MKGLHWRKSKKNNNEWLRVVFGVVGDTGGFRDIVPDEINVIGFRGIKEIDATMRYVLDWYRSEMREIEEDISYDREPKKYYWRIAGYKK